MAFEVADKILLSDAMFTGLVDEPICGGVAIKNNKIIGVGSKAEVLQYKGAATSVLDYGDQLLLPGFCDSHIHLLLGCMFAQDADLSAAKSEAEAVEMLYAKYETEKAEYEADEWVLGFSWYNLWWDDTALPTKASLDKYFPDRPVFLLNADAHAAWVNSKALELAGVDKHTANPDYGTLVRFEDGEPTGFLEEMAMALCMKYAYDVPANKQKTLLKNTLPLFSKYGITAVNDMQYFFGTNMGNLDVYQALADSGELKVRINFANGLLNDLDFSRELKQKYSGEKLCYNGVKEFVDGIVTTHTSVMLAPYTDEPAASLRFDLMDLKKAGENIKALQKEGFNVHLHATGDGAVRQAIDFYEAAIKENGFTKSRLSIEHMDLTDPADLPRLGKCGIVASVQPPHITLSSSLATNDYPVTVGEARSKQLWSYKSMLANGANLAFGTDYPVVAVDPMIGLHRAVTRVFPDGKPLGGWNPQEKLDLATALKAYTLGGAYKDGKEACLGTLEVGKLADIAVVDKNLFAIPAAEILNCQIAMTMMDGEIVYEK